MRTHGLRPIGKLRLPPRPAASNGARPAPPPENEAIALGRPHDALMEGMIRPSEIDAPDPGMLPCGRRGVATPQAEPARGPRFDRSIPLSGYSWWYIDAISDDGKHALTVIFFLGSVFSPYYARARRTGPAEPLDHSSVNVCLYGANGRRWAMTERGRDAVSRSADTLVIGPSAVRWTGSMLEISLDERTFPRPGRVQGTIRVQPRAMTDFRVALDARGEHHWSPVGPDSRVEVDLRHPGLRWSGTGYFDTNSGVVPLEHSFVRWTWARAPFEAGTAALYDIDRRDGSTLSVALRIDRAGKVEMLDSPPLSPLPRGSWGVDRGTRADPGHQARLCETLEDTPFYTRSVIETRLFGSAVTGVHESLCLDRFKTGWVQALLPFRMPRWAG